MSTAWISSIRMGGLAGAVATALAAGFGGMAAAGEPSAQVAALLSEAAGDGKLTELLANRGLTAAEVARALRAHADRIADGPARQAIAKVLHQNLRSALRDGVIAPETLAKAGWSDRAMAMPERILHGAPSLPPSKPAVVSLDPLGSGLVTVEVPAALLSGLVAEIDDPAAYRGAVFAAASAAPEASTVAATVSVGAGGVVDILGATAATAAPAAKTSGEDAPAAEQNFRTRGLATLGFGNRDLW